MAEERIQLEHEFIDCAKSSNWDGVKILLAKSPALVNVQPAGRWSALHQAAHDGNVGVVNYLLQRGADLNQKTRSGKLPADVAKGEAKTLLAPKVSEDAPPPPPDDGEKLPEPPTKKFKAAAAARHRLNVNNAVDAEFQDSSLAEIAAAPVSALQGIAVKGRDVLKRFNIKTVRDLGSWKFYRIAKAISGLAALEQEGKRSEHAALNINKALDQKYETKGLRDILRLPPSALQGLAAWADEALEKVGITTIAKLGEWKFARWAEWIVELADYENADFSSL